jgi:hypothetical protein
MTTYEHATLMSRVPKGGQGGIYLITALGETLVNADSVGLRWLMKELDDLAAEGWEPVGSATVAYFPDDLAVTSFLLRRPMRSGEPHVR